MRIIKLLSLFMLLSCFFLNGCGQNTSSSEAKNEINVKRELNTAKAYTDAQLYELAKGELKNNDIHFYSFTSIAEKVAENFVKKYPAYKNKLHYHYLGDENMYDDAIKRMESNNSGIDFVITHSDLMHSLRQRDLVCDYMPMKYERIIPEKYSNPTCFGMLNTIFMYKAGEGKPEINNVWALTEGAWQNKIIFKDPLQENSNLFFMVMLTSPKWTKQLEKAYQQYYGRAWSSRVYKSAAYEWIDKFITNCDLSYGNNTKIAKAIPIAMQGTMFFTGYNKLRKLKKRDKDNVGIWAFDQKVQGFSGYAYGAYVAVSKNSDNPYSSALFINYILSEKGFGGKGAWNEFKGYYTTNPEFEKSKEVQDVKFSYWEDKLVIEDPEYVAENTGKVSKFIVEALSKKRLANMKKEG